MTFQKRGPHRLDNVGRSNGWQEYLYALLLLRNDMDVTERDLRFIAETSLSIEAELAIWTCKPVESFQKANRFSFRRLVDERRYQIDKKGTSLIFVEFDGPLLSGRIAVEVRVPGVFGSGLEIISTWGDDFDPSIFVQFNQDRVFLRALVAEGTGKRAVLLPREHGYQVIRPMSDAALGNGDSAAVLDLNDFISQSYAEPL